MSKRQPLLLTPFISEVFQLKRESKKNAALILHGFVYSSLWREQSAGLLNPRERQSGHRNFFVFLKYRAQYVNFSFLDGRFKNKSDISAVLIYCRM